MVLKADNEFKVRRRIFTLIHFTLFSVSVIVLFVTLDCLSLQWRKTDWIQFTPVIVLSKRDCPLLWKLVEYTFNHWTSICKDVRCKRSKQLINASQDRCEIPLCWNNLFLDKQIVCLRQADYMRRNSLLIKYIKNRLFTKNCITQTEILLVSFLMCFIFYITPGLLVPKIGV